MSEKPDILKRCEALGYKTFDLDMDVNLIGVRSKETADEFNDSMHLVYRKGPEWKHHVWPITCDPGRHYMDHPMNSIGTARLLPGQYRKSYKLGMHNGSYRALVQCRPVRVERTRNGEVVGTFTGMFGINIHRASADGTPEFVNRWSAGCQVFQKREDFEKCLEIVRQSMVLFSPFVSYTLLED
jgi:hypothetical protein